MKLLVIFCLLLVTATTFAQQRSSHVDSVGNTDNMPVVKGRGNSINMPTKKSRGDAVDIPTKGVPAPMTSGSDNTNGRFNADSSDRTKSVGKQPLPKNKPER